MGRYMINYSVYMFKNALMEESEEKAYARNQVSKVMSFDEFVRHISAHNGVFSRGTVKGVVSDTCNCLVELLLNGNKVKFLDDNVTYLGNQLPCAFDDSVCFGVVANMEFLLVCTYEENGEHPELIVYKKR